MMRLRPEQLVCVLLALSLGGLAWWTFAGTSKRPRSDSDVMPTGAQPAPADPAATAPAAPPRTWSQPQPQSRGRAWVFELFTPPEIEYNAATREHRVKPSVEDLPRVAVAAATSDSAPVLLGVRPEDYPLQLTGFLGEGSQALGIFENRHSGETLLLRAGDRVPELDLEVVTFAVGRTAVVLPESMTVHETRARAVVREPGGDTRSLLQGEIAPGTALRARLVLGDETLELPEGAVFTQGPFIYRLDKIRLAPESVAVTKENADDGSTEKLVLHAKSPPDTTQP